MAPTDPPLLPPPPEQLLLPAPEAPLLLAAPESTWKRHAKPISAIVLASVLLLAFAIGWFVHHRRAEAADRSNEEARDAIPIITVVPVKRSATLSELLLPGSLSPLTEASMYARASGYVTHRYVDIGDIVTKGQILAEIDSPELDQQYAQGLAAVAQAKQQLNQANASVGDAQARLDLARVTVQRYETLLAQDSIARQDVDVQRQTYQSAVAALVSAKANVGAAQDNVRAAQANADRLLALQRFEKLRAPFDGVVTARNVDEGTLISSSGSSLIGSSGSGSTSTPAGATGSSSTSGSAGGDSGSSSGSGGANGGASGSGAELFRIAQVDRLRVYVNVPQENAGAIQIGADAGVFIQQFAQRFAGRVARTAHAIDTSSRTLLTEVQIPNGDRTLMPGMYAQVRFASERSNPPLLVPGETVIARASGTSVATLVPLNDDDRQKLADQDDRRCARKIHLQPVVVGRDYGTDVEIASGLRSQDMIVLNPGDTVRENAVMLPELQKKQGDDAGGSGNDKDNGKDNGKDKKKSSDQGGKGDDKKDDPKARAKADKERRQGDQQHCIDDQVRQAQASASSPAAQDGSRPAPAGEALSVDAGASGTPGGPSDHAPSGNQSPSIQAPTQGAGKSAQGGGGKKPT